MSQTVLITCESSAVHSPNSTTAALHQTEKHALGQPCSVPMPVTEPVAFPRAVRNLRLDQHARTRSDTSIPTSPLSQTHTNRSRASSAASRPPLSGTSSRSRVHSFCNLGTRSVPKADLVQPVMVEPEETIGSFIPTNCPRQRLHSLLGTSAHLKETKRDLYINTNFSPPFRQGGNFDDFPGGFSSPPESPIPSICRTPSSYTDSEYFPSIPSSTGPHTPIHPTISSPHFRNHSLQTAEILEILESRSKFHVRTSCATCHKAGSNFPCCPRCGEMWCSRECRLRGGNGKRHICSIKSGER